jgi:hypothetical protein
VFCLLGILRLVLLCDGTVEVGQLEIGDPILRRSRCWADDGRKGGVFQGNFKRGSIVLNEAGWRTVGLALKAAGSVFCTRRQRIFAEKMSLPVRRAMLGVRWGPKEFWRGGG